MIRRRQILLWMAAVFFLIPTAKADPSSTWAIDYAQSRLGFQGVQSSSPFEGSFKTFQVRIDLDPQTPEKGHIIATIDTGSATTGDDDRDHYLPQKDWFNSAAFPQAQFQSDHIVKTGVDQYLAQGTLTIKGMSHALALPFTLKSEGDHWHAQSKVPLSRLDFQVGQGDWSSEEYVNHAVNVVIDLVARPLQKN